MKSIFIAATAVLVLSTTACSGDEGEADSAVVTPPSAAPAPSASTDASEAGTPEAQVEAFYANIVTALKAGDIETVCSMSTVAFTQKYVKLLNEAGVPVKDCQQVWKYLLDVTPPESLDDPLSELKVNGKTATFLSGDDPWTVVQVGEKWYVTSIGE